MKCMEHVHKAYAPEVTPRQIGELLTEADIFFLSDTFFSHGFHYIQVKDIASGRRLITTFMRSIKINNETAILTTIDTTGIDNTFFDIVTEMRNHSMANPNDCEDFLLEHLFATFLWIELTETLQTEPWFEHCMQAMIELKIDRQIPIIILSYQE